MVAKKSSREIIRHTQSDVIETHATVDMQNCQKVSVGGRNGLLLLLLKAALVAVYIPMPH